MKSFSEYDFETFFALMNVKLIPRGRGQFMAACPFGHNHASGRDKHPSMSVVYGGITSGFKCFGCNDKGTIRFLAKKYNEQCGDSRALEYIKSFDDKSSFGERAIKKGTYQQEQSKKIARMYRKAPEFKKPINDEELQYYMNEVPSYAYERGLTDREIIKFEVGYDPDEERMIVPIRDMHKKLMGISGRAISEETKPKWKHYPGFSKELVMYGEHLIDIKNTTCFIVEGFLDVIMLNKIGLKNVFATMGTSISEYQEKKILRFMKTVIFIPDGEDVGKGNAGLKFAESYGRKLLISGLRVGIAGIENNELFKDRDNGEKPAKWEESDFKYKIVPPLHSKDPADLSSDELRKVLQQIKWVSLI